MRITEDKLIQTLLGCTPRHEFIPDSSARVGPPAASWRVNRGYTDPPRRIVAPLGVGSHPDHLITRRLATALWKRWGSALTLYEDLPYAFYSSDLRKEEGTLLIESGLEDASGSFERMDQQAIARKLALCKLYLTQRCDSRALLSQARAVGRENGVEFAERYFLL